MVEAIPMSDADNGSLLTAFLESGGVPFQTILADCPWPSGKRPNPGGKREHWMRTNMNPRYRTMKAADILGLPVNDIAAPDALLVLWTTWMHLALAMGTIDAWGFRYCTGMPWLKVVNGTANQLAELDLWQGIRKPIFGPGPWFQHCTELVLIARRGRPFGSEGNPRPARKGIIIHPRLTEHSRKPEELQEWIDQKFPGPKLEMFARRTREGWTTWGDEISPQ